jgi:hypothetical protein
MSRLNRRELLKYSALASASMIMPIKFQYGPDQPLFKKSLKYGMIKEGTTVL